MNKELERRLAEYEKTSPVTRDEELITALERIIEDESKLPAAERNCDLIDDAVDVILSLKGVDVDMLEKRANEYTERHLEAARDMYNADRKRRGFKLKDLVSVAALVSVILVGTMVASAGRHNSNNDSFANLESKFVESADINSSGEYYEFSSLEELAKAPAYDTLIKPAALPKGYGIEHISVQRSCLEVEEGYLVDYTLLDMVMRSGTDKVTLKVEYPAFDFDPEGIELVIGGKSVYCRELNGEFCGSFISEGQIVTVTSPLIHTLKNVVLSLH